MHVTLADRPQHLFSLGVQLLALKYKALELTEDELAKAIDTAIAEADSVLLQLMEDLAVDAEGDTA